MEAKKEEGRKLLDSFLQAAKRDGVTHLKDPASVAPSQAPSSDAAILGWLNPETGKTCSAAEKLSMEQHQGMPGLHIANGFSIPLFAARVMGMEATSSQQPMTDEQIYCAWDGAGCPVPQDDFRAIVRCTEGHHGIAAALPSPDQPKADAGVSVGQPAHSKSEYKRRVAMGDPNVAPPPGVLGAQIPEEKKHGAA